MKILQRVKNNFRLILYSLCLITVAWTISYIFAPQQVNLFFDNKISDQTRVSIKNYIDKISIRSMGARRLYNNLKQDYSLLASISIDYNKPLLANIKLHTLSPKVCLLLNSNSKYVLVSNGEIIESKLFSADSLENLPEIKIDNQNQLAAIKTASIYTSILSLKSDIFEKYCIIWRSKTELLLKSLNDEKLVIIADNESIHKNAKLAYAERIYETNQDKYKKGMQIDIRLKDSILCGSLGRMG